MYKQATYINSYICTFNNTLNTIPIPITDKNKAAREGCYSGLHLQNIIHTLNTLTTFYDYALCSFKTAVPPAAGAAKALPMYKQATYINSYMCTGTLLCSVTLRTLRTSDFVPARLISISSRTSNRTQFGPLERRSVPSTVLPWNTSHSEVHSKTARIVYSWCRCFQL